MPATVVAIGMLGFLLAVSFVRYRTAWALGNLLEYPVWLICGFLVPLTLFPDWVRPISWVLRADLGHAGDPPVGAGRDADPRRSLVLRSGSALVYTARSACSSSTCVLARRPAARERWSLDVSSLPASSSSAALLSFRALFGWLSPVDLDPDLLVAPIFQILLFVYIGRAANAQSDEFYVIGNAIQYAAIPCIFAMTNTIAGERYQNTLGVVLVTPAKRIPLFLGRSLPVIVNGVLRRRASRFVVGGAIVGISVPARLGAGDRARHPRHRLRVHRARAGDRRASGSLARETATLNNIVFGILLVFCGANVPLDDLPGWMSTIAQGLPLTHGIEAARRLADGASLSSASAGWSRPRRWSGLSTGSWSATD